MSKYNADKCNCDGYHFDSHIEMKYYEHLKDIKAKELIMNFELQPRFTLQGKFTKDGKNYRMIEYVADFIIYHIDGTEEVIDVKGFAVETAKIKKKLFNYKYQNMKLTWICRYGGKWVDYDENIKARAKRKKAKNDK